MGSLAVTNWASKLIPETARETIKLRLFGLAKIPMLYFARPVITEISSERAVVRIPLRRRTKNHHGSMYFGALSIGADCAAGALAMHLMRQRSERISMIFGGFSAEFHKRAEGDVEFCCDQGRGIAELVSQAAASEERVAMPVSVIATVPELDSEPVATFRLTLSLKKRP